MGSETTGQTNAIWYTLIESCRRRKIDPWQYLVWIFEELPAVKVTASTFEQYTPEAYASGMRKTRCRKTA
jgi:transposase